ncbi:MAG: quinoprotein dehydrogenase-associated SoxYZ-like carrier [Amaricoccus sp.]|uniref:quinoprotein dehydrogenase-associated SoxYZ-like carrier n=1 Tax=Amaricoccus sp. TaxID=1872485 RepID=UPI0039E61D63
MTAFRRLAALLLASLLACGPALADDRPSPLQPSDSWDAIRGDVAAPGEIRDGAGLYALEAPMRAEDAAAVPVRITAAPGAPEVKRVTLVVDENPAPVAATFEIGAAMQPLDLEIRLRVDAYSNLRAIIEAADGRQYMTGRFVRASGGCSAPAATDAAAAKASLGQMKVRWFDTDPDGRREAQVMLRHPNNSGMQRDQVTLLFIPADFVNSLVVSQGAEPLFTVTGGISISENPTFRFRYLPNGAPISVRATDTDGGVYQGTFPADS